MGMNKLFIYNGKSSLDFDMHIAKVNQYDGAERDTEEIEVAGRNGTLTIDKGRFKNIEISYSMYTIDVGNANDFKAFLKSSVGYHRLEDSFNPEYFRLAKYTRAFEMRADVDNNGAFDVVFNCDPRRFLKSGENVILMSSNSGIYNPTYFEAKPLIRAYGTGSFTINDITVTITSANEYTDIDCEIMDAYKGATNCNGNIRTTDNKFPVFRSGQNNITLNGVTRLEITPRWWTV